MNTGAVIWFVLIGLVFVAFVMAICVMVRTPLPIYRKIVARTDRSDGELVELECGHRLLLVHHRRQSMPCEDCAKEKLTK